MLVKVTELFQSVCLAEDLKFYHRHMWLLADDDLHDGDLWLNGLFSGQVPPVEYLITPQVCLQGRSVRSKFFARPSIRPDPSASSKVNAIACSKPHPGTWHTEHVHQACDIWLQTMQVPLMLMPRLN